MDSDRVAGAATNVGGKIKDAVGGLVGDSKTQLEGKADQLSGQVQNAYGSAKDAVREGAQTVGTQLDEFVHERPLMALLAAAGLGFLIQRLLHR